MDTNGMHISDDADVESENSTDLTMSSDEDVTLGPWVRNNIPKLERSVVKPATQRTESAPPALKPPVRASQQGKSWFAKLLSVSTDNRKDQRVPAHGLVAYYWEGGAPTAHDIQNISASGFYLLTKERWRPGTLVTMTLQRTDIADAASERYISVQSKVIHLGEDGIGFVFVPQEVQGSGQVNVLKSAPANKKALDRFLDQLKSHQAPQLSQSSWRKIWSSQDQPRQLLRVAL